MANGPSTDRTERLRAYDQAVARLSRRQLLRLAGMAGASVVVAPMASARNLLAQSPSTASLGAFPFTLGVASGDPLPGAVVLWTRLAPRPLEGGGMPMANVEVAWEVATDAAFRTIVRKGTEIARPELGHSVHADVHGLEPGHEYFYRFHAAGEVSQIGRTRTAPALGGSVDRLRFAVCGCSHFESGYFTAYQRIAEEGFDFVFHTGDYIYEGRGDTTRAGRVRHHHGDEIYNLVDYRNRYAQYKGDPDLMAAHASAPFIVSWDDHEVDNDYAGLLDERDTPSELFLLRRAAAYQAYYESMPLRTTSMPSGPNMRIFRHLAFGRLIDFHVLDTRQWRSKQACGGGSRSDCADALSPQRTILGREQEAWLFDRLGAADRTWTVIGQQVPTYARDSIATNPAARFSMDKWDGYAASRQRLYERLIETRAPNPVILSGDVHLAFGSDLKMDYTNPKSQTVGVELTNTSITSGSDGSDVSATWERFRADNAHIRYHSARRGYIACMATPTHLRADFKVIERVTVAGDVARTGGSLIVEAGQPGLAKA